MSYGNEDTDYYGDRRTSVTVPQRFVEAADRFENDPAQAYCRRGPGPVRSLEERAFPRPPEGERGTVKYGDLSVIVADLAAGFRRLADEGDRVALLAGNRAEWAQVDLALQAAGLVVVTVPPDASAAETRSALVEQDVADAVVADGEAVSELAPALEGGFAVLLDGTHATDAPVAVHTLAAVRRDGREAFDPSLYERWVFDRSPDTVATVVYDRMTDEGRRDEDAPLRGMELSHAAIAAGVESAVTGGTGRPDPEKAPREALPRPSPGKTVLVARSPASPVARATAHLAPLTVGGQVAYAAPERPLVDDLRETEPDLAYLGEGDPGTVVDTLRARAAEGLGSGLVKWALDREVGESEGDVLDRLALRRLRGTFEDVGPLLLPAETPGSAAAALGRIGLSARRYRALPGTMAAVVEPTASELEADPETFPPTPVPGLESEWEEATPVESAAELRLRGPAVFDGFPADPGATLGSFDRDDWFRSDLHRGPDGGILRGAPAEPAAVAQPSAEEGRADGRDEAAAEKGREAATAEEPDDEDTGGSRESPAADLPDPADDEDRRDDDGQGGGRGEGIQATSAAD